MSKIIGKKSSNFYRALNISSETKTERYRIWVLANLYLLALAPSTIFAVVHIFKQMWFSAGVNILNSIIFGTGLWLIYRKKYLISKYILLSSAILAISLNASVLGRGSGNYIFMFPIFSSMFVIFDIKDVKHIIFFFFMIVICLILLDITDYSFLKNETIPESYIQFNFYFSYIFSFILQFAILFLIVYSLKKYEKRLEVLNQKMIKKNQNLEKANYELDSFVYKASHDLRAPLVSLMGLVELIKHTDSESEKAKYIELQEKSIKKLDNNVKDILDISRNARLPVEMQTFDLKEVISASFQNLSHLHKERNFILNFDIKGSSIINSDLKRWQVIINNILSNVVKYSDLSKQKNTLNVTISRSNSAIYIVFEDNGIGIKQEVIEKVFQMYFRGNSDSFGSGLGLYMVKENVEKLGGKISINSQYGIFTQLKIELPLEHTM